MNALGLTLIPSPQQNCFDAAHVDFSLEKLKSLLKSGFTFFAVAHRSSWDQIPYKKSNENVCVCVYIYAMWAIILSDCVTKYHVQQPLSWHAYRAPRFILTLNYKRRNTLPHSLSFTEKFVENSLKKGATHRRKHPNTNNFMI